MLRLMEPLSFDLVSFPLRSNLIWMNEIFFDIQHGYEIRISLLHTKHFRLLV